MFQITYPYYASPKARRNIVTFGEKQGYKHKKQTFPHKTLLFTDDQIIYQRTVDKLESMNLQISTTAW